MEFVVTVGVLLFAVVVHEYAHGWEANRRGDPTAKLAGRLTLNPLKHIDLVGMIIVPVVLRLLGFVPFGWAKPVPVNFRNLFNPKTDMIWVAAAGPAVNLFLAAVFSVLLKVPVPGWAAEIFSLVIVLNLLLAVFNLVPVPPLDGSRILMGLLPRPLDRYYGYLEPFGFIILLFLLNYGFLDFVWGIVAVLAAHLGVASAA